jgi:hypothetical protein
MRVEVDAEGRTLRQLEAKNLNADLTTHADVGTAEAIPLSANKGLASPGFKLHGAGFILEPEEAGKLVRAVPGAAELVRPYRNGRDLTNRPRGAYVIDFGTRTEKEARAGPEPIVMVGR